MYVCVVAADISQSIMFIYPRPAEFISAVIKVYHWMETNLQKRLTLEWALLMFCVVVVAASATAGERSYNAI
jgi:cytochrome b subunit of formate dehydrogenase